MSGWYTALCLGLMAIAQVGLLCMAVWLAARAAHLMAHAERVLDELSGLAVAVGGIAGWLLGRGGAGRAGDGP